MQSNCYVACIFTIVGIAAAPTVQAHALASDIPGFLAGFSHPLLALDHVLAMVAVGLWATQQLGRGPVWPLPVVFVAVMTLGAVLAQWGLVLPMAEAGIMSSLVVLGLLLALAIRPRALTGMALVGLFAVFHGNAHGVEIPHTASTAVYGLGFVVATASLHLVGIGIGNCFKRAPCAALLRLSGGAIATSGILLWV